MVTYKQTTARQTVNKKGLKDYIVIVTETKKTITKSTIKAFLEQLPKDVFMRVNKSYIVNLKRITSFNSCDIFIGEREIGIGASYREGFLKAMGVGL